MRQSLFWKAAWLLILILNEIQKIQLLAVNNPGKDSMYNGNALMEGFCQGIFPLIHINKVDLAA